LRVLGFQRGVTVMAVLCLVPALFAAMTGVDDLNLTTKSAVFDQLFSEKTLWLAAAVFFLYAPLEAAINIWATTYLTDFGHSERGAAWALSGFWAAFLASRLLAALALHHWPMMHGWDWLLIVLPALLVAVILGNLAGTASRGAAWRGLLLLGFLLGRSFRRWSARCSSSWIRARWSASALLTAHCSRWVRSAVWCWRRSSVSARRAITCRRRLRIPMLLAIALTLAALVFVLMR